MSGGELSAAEPGGRRAIRAGILITGTLVTDWHAWAVAHHYAFSD